MRSNQQIPETKMKKTNFSSTLRRLIPALLAAESDQFTHPFDTIARRLQNHQGKIDSFTKFKHVAFNIKPDYSPTQRVHSSLLDFKTYRSLFDGFGYSTLNKALTRTYRFCTQSYLETEIENNFYPHVIKYLNDAHARTFFSGLAGFISGISETIIFHPLDTFKTRKQLGTEFSFNGLYKGIAPALYRNSVASAVFFGSYQFIISHIKQNEIPTPTENFFASCSAALINTVVTNPLDVIKTRLQAKPSTIGMFAMISDIAKKEGLGAFGKGLLFKCGQSPLRVALPLFVYKQVSEWLSTNNHSEDEKPSMNLKK